MRLGGLEAGGTKMVCAIGNENGEIEKQVSFPTTSPEETMPKIIEFFAQERIEALGIGCFGPIDPVKGSETYGYITTTPKKGWNNFPIVREFEKALQIPVGFDTDVNSSVLGEVTFGDARELHSCVYLTIGTGIGAGVYVNGMLLHGNMHPEAGHILIRRKTGDTFEGCCPFHGDCFEGMASGPAIEKRYGQKAVELFDREDVWNLEAHYIAQALVIYTLNYAPQKIILGGGVMHQLQLFPLIRAEFEKLLAGYICTKEVKDLEHYIVPASLNDMQGAKGCLELARRVLEG